MLHLDSSDVHMQLQPFTAAMTEAKAPWLTHAGLMRVGRYALPVYQLSDGRRVTDVFSTSCFFQAAPEYAYIH